VPPRPRRSSASASGRTRTCSKTYHQQITKGNLIPNIDRCWDEIGYFQCDDNPGRKEPGTGEIHYRNVFGHIKKKGWQGVVGMEHGLSKDGAEGEKALLQAYRAVDPA
jgi:hydroxypyruvate isomerase